MNKAYFAYVLLLFCTLMTTSLCQTFACDQACGGNGGAYCSDFSLSTTSPNNCMTCAAGYVGGSGKASSRSNPKPCVKGTCNSACTACQDSSNQNCYLCSPGYFDPISSPILASPCNACHSSCKTCKNGNADGCYVCADGYFDAQNNPYSAGSCQKCDSSCKNCSKSATNCIGGCAAGYSLKNGSCELTDSSLVINKISTCSA